MRSVVSRRWKFSNIVVCVGFFLSLSRGFTSTYVDLASGSVFNIKADKTDLYLKDHALGCTNIQFKQKTDLTNLDGSD